MLYAMVFAQLDFRRLNLASYPLARAFALSLLFHAVLFMTVELGHQTGLWRATFLFSKRAPAQLDPRLARLLADANKKEEQETREIPLVFVDVDPSQASEEPPKDAKYYSALNSKAANPDTRLDMAVPKIEGKQDKVPQTMDRARPGPQPLQPAPPPSLPPQVAETKPEPEPPPAEPPQPQPEVRPKPTVEPGDLALAKPADKPREELAPNPSDALQQPKPPPRHARSLAEAKQKKGGMAGPRMKQEGGVRNFRMDPALDVRATPFGSYDGAIIAAIQKHWYDLLDQRPFAANFSGKVILEFRLNSNGSVSDMKVTENTVTEVLALVCQRAVQEPAPFAKWPADLRRLVGKDYREVRFTFYYN